MDLRRLLRLGNALYLAFITIDSLCCALSPRLAYAELDLFYRRLDWHPLHTDAPAFYTPNVEQLDWLMLYASICVAPLIAYRCWRASALITEAMLRGERLSPLPLQLMLAQIVCHAMPAWGRDPVRHYGQSAVLAGVALWMICHLSIVCYVCAVASVVDEREGKEPGSLALSWGHNLGGFWGTKLAKAAFGDSETLIEVDRKPPFAVVFIAGMIIVSALVRMTS